MKQELQNYNSKMIQIQNDDQGQSEIARKLQDNLEEANQEIKSLKSQNGQMKSNLDKSAVDERVSKMTEQLTELESNVRDLKQLDDNSQKQIAELQ